MKGHVAFFGLERADPTIPWPERGSAEKELCERDGWERRTIPVMWNGKPSTMEAMCKGELAVNRMLSEEQGEYEEGFAICLASTGWRISAGGRVYVSCSAAMDVAEAMLEACQDWESAQHSPYSDAQRRVVLAFTDAAEQRGEILLDRVYPK